ALFFGDGLGEASTTKSQIIPPKRVRYLSEIVDANKNYDAWVNEQCVIASKLYQINGVLLEKEIPELIAIKNKYEQQLHTDCKKLIDSWTDVV
ncbi:hypothetical protein ABTM64_20040, partial [Acinetobacter baumannii]